MSKATSGSCTDSTSSLQSDGILQAERLLMEFLQRTPIFYINNTNMSEAVQHLEVTRQ